MTWGEVNDALAAFVATHEVLGRLIFTSVEFAALALLVGVLIVVFRLRQPRLRALLWLMVLAKPLVGLAIGTPLPLFLLTPPTAPPVMPLAVDPRPLAPPINFTPVFERAPVAAIAEPAPPPIDYGALALKAVLGLWLAGCAAMGARLLVNAARLRRMIRAAAEPSPWLKERLAEAARSLKLGAGRLPRLCVTGELESPALAGFWRPVILVPAWLGAEADPRQVDWSLRHELMHWSMRDPLASLLRELARILFFFHPAAWWAGRKWQEATEMACDRALINSMEDAEMYVQELYRMLLKVRSRRRVPVAGGLFAGRTQISQRIASLVKDPLRAPARLSAGAVALVVLLSAASLSVGVGVKADDGVSASPATLPGVVLGDKAGPTTSTLPVQIKAAKMSARGESGLVLEGDVRYGLSFGSFAAVVAGDRIEASTNAKTGWVEMKIASRPLAEREAMLVELARSASRQGAPECVWASADQVTAVPNSKECRLEGNALLVQKIDATKLRIFRSTMIFLNEDASGHPSVAISGKGPKVSQTILELDPAAAAQADTKSLSGAADKPSGVDAAAPTSQTMAAEGWTNGRRIPSGHPGVPIDLMRGDHAVPFDFMRGDQMEIDPFGTSWILGNAKASLKLGRSVVTILGDRIGTTETAGGAYAIRIDHDPGTDPRGKLPKPVIAASPQQPIPYWLTAAKALVGQNKIVLTGDAIAVSGDGKELRAETLILTPDAKSGELHIEPSSQKFPIAAPLYRPKQAKVAQEVPFIHLTWMDVKLQPVDPAQLDKGFKLVLTAANVDPKIRMTPIEVTGMSMTNEAGQKRIVFKGGVKVSDGKSLDAKADELVCAEKGGHVVLTLTGNPEWIQEKGKDPNGKKEKIRVQADKFEIELSGEGQPRVSLLQAPGSKRMPKIEVIGTGNAQTTVSVANKLAAEDLAAAGWRLWRERKLPEAEAEFKKALEKDPTNANTWNGLGWAQLNQGKPLNAQKSFEEAVKRDPKHAASLNGLGWVAKGQGKTDEAIGYWKRAVEASPEATAALAGLAQTAMERKNYKDAERYYEQWLKAEPGNAEARDGLEKAKAGESRQE